jgi:hypothetical protein
MRTAFHIFLILTGFEFVATSLLIVAAELYDAHRARRSHLAQSAAPQTISIYAPEKG